MSVDRREFIQLCAGATALTLLSGCKTKTLAPKHSTSPQPVTSTEFTALRRMADTPFGRIAYVDRGSGDAALFLHGFPLNSFQWRDVIARLTSDRRCIAPDFLGLGYTEVKAGQSVGPLAQVAMIIHLLDSLSISSVDLIANDSGGAVAQLIATRHPNRIRTMLLTNCDVEPDSPPAAVLPVIDLARQGKFADAWLAPWVVDKNLARSPKGLGGLTYTHPDRLTDATIDYYLAPLVSSPQRKSLTNAYAVGLSPNPLAGIESDLKRCTIPTRIVWGTGDDIFSQSSPDYLHKLLPASRGIRRVAGAKLFFPEEFPDLIADEARQLWRS
ncbi:MAG TPA: alpha/beta hydrolase [Terriglobales bacterium]|nr:alpha/beta hydrolase [Terriglobales bacterium]